MGFVFRCEAFLYAITWILLLHLVVVYADSPISPPTYRTRTSSLLIEPLAAMKTRFLLHMQRLLGVFGLSSTPPTSTWDVIEFLALVFLCLWLFNKQSRKRKGDSQCEDLSTNISDTVGIDAVAIDPGLLKKHSTYRSYHVPSTGYTYPSIRTFYRPHPQDDKLPRKPAPIPLLVFIHGLGGSVAQFHPLLKSLVNLAPCLSVDLPGCGLSKFEPTAWETYTTDALVQLLAVIVDDHRDRAAGQGVVLIGHSMGCSLATFLASSTSPYASLISEHVLGLVAICPRAGPPTRAETATFRRLLSIPGPVFDLWRRFDRRGGTESASVARFTGPDAEAETKKLQVRFNEQSSTPVWRRMAAGLLPDYSSGQAKGGLPGKEVWSGLDMPVFLIAGEADKVTPAGEVEKIGRFLSKTTRATTNATDATDAIPDSAAPVDTGFISGSVGSSTGQSESSVESLEALVDRADGAALSTTEVYHNKEGRSVNEFGSRRQRCLKISIIPAPAAHALLYAPSTARILSGLIQGFLAEHIDKRLSLGWQLQYLTTEGKWDVKNLAKWQAVQPVSEPIAGVFYAMKTLREVDDKHSPTVFVRDWKGKIRAVVDISHESPVYDPDGLEKGGIEYYKFPTVSKLPPTVDEVKSFIDLIDSIRSKASPRSEGEETPVIGVHCHYGFNRTGFFIVCYLVERLGFRLQDAIEEFRIRRPPGIRHEHFIDTLYVRYCVGLKRAPTS